MAKVSLTHGPENVKPEVKPTGEIGKFCFEVPSGEYRITAFADGFANAPDLLFSPPFFDVTVNRPISDIQFSQALVSIHGTVAYRDTYDSSVSVKLIKIVTKKDEEVSTLGLTDNSNKFTFTNVYPGKYRLEVKHVLPGSREDIWCWQQSFVLIGVGAEDVHGIEFVQQGYKVNIISSHDVGAKMIQSNGSSVDLQIKKGSQQMCLENPGVHELQLADSCIFFGRSSVIIDISKPPTTLINLTAEKYRIHGKIHVDTNSFGNEAEFPETISVDILSGGTLFETSTDKPVLSDPDHTSVYEYSVWSHPGQKYVIVPKDSRDANKRILFYPREQNVSVVNHGCQGLVQPVIGRMGLYVEGSVSPSIPGVHRKIFVAGDSLNSPLRIGEVAFETETSNNGIFISGPLYDDISHNVEAFKPGSKTSRPLQFFLPEAWSNKCTHLFRRRK